MKLSACVLAGAGCIGSVSAFLNHQLGFHSRVSPLHQSRKPSAGGVGGKIVVSGIGKADDDEFLLTLLNEQSIWDSVILATDNSAAAKKKFLSRTARYSGLLNVLDFVDVSESPDSFRDVLKGANAWIAFNVSRADVASLSESALSAGVQRAVFAVELPEASINDTGIAEFAAAAELFRAAGGSFTGVRHGRVVPGNEDNPYEIVNASVPCLDTVVEKGVLARVTAELLRIDKSANQECGLSSSGPFAAAYLNILRSSGLTRQEEVSKMFSGGLQRVARLTVDEYEAEGRRAEEAKARTEKRKMEALAEAAADRAQAGLELAQMQALSAPVDSEEEQDAIEELTAEDKIQRRTQAILRNVWREFETRLYSKSTSKEEFLEANKERARALAEKEYSEDRVKRRALLEEKRSRQDLLDRLVDVNRKQYSKLLALERRELQSQKDISAVWVRYIYMLLERTVQDCLKRGALFHNLDEFAQTVLLRAQANALRAECSLSAYDLVYDPLDAAVIVAKLAADFPEVVEDSDEMYRLLESKHGNTLKNVPALRGAKQIISAAVETLQLALPPAPPSVNEIRQGDSATKQQLVSQMRIQATRNRGKPKSAEESQVGRL